MGFVIRLGAAAAVAAVAGAAIIATPPQPTAASSLGLSTPVNLTASSSLYLSPLALVPEGNSRLSDAATAAVAAALTPDPDQIDEQFIEFRNAARTDFHAFANKLGYLGKQLYIGVNFGETIVASAVFNGTDMLRGEGVLKNLGEIAGDVSRAGLWVVADNLYLALPGLPPIVILPERGPVDSPPEWRRPLPPQLGRPLVVPFPDGPEPSAALDSDVPTLADQISAPKKDTAAVPAAATVVLQDEDWSKVAGFDLQEPEVEASKAHQGQEFHRTTVEFAEPVQRGEGAVRGGVHASALYTRAAAHPDSVRRFVGRAAPAGG